MSNLLSCAEERVYFKDLMSRFVLISEGWIAAYAPGRTAAELIGKTDFDVFSEHHASSALADEQQIITTGEPIVGKVERETYQGRADAWVSTTKMPLRDSRGAIIGTFGISRDVTAQIRAEQILARHAQRLSSQNESLRELDRLKDEFIGLVSHELRTPLTSIIGYVELLKDARARHLDTGQFADVIQRNAERLLRLVGDLLFLSRMQAGAITTDFRSVDPGDIAARALEEIRPEAERKHIGLSLAATSVPDFAADPDRLSQLLGNLLSNAVKFTPDGGRVAVTLSQEADQVVLTVADTGIGIPVADRDRVFERFFRTAAATQRAIPGTGLGLTITKAIVDAHHGTITAGGNEAGGTTFRICLPLRAVAESPRAAASLGASSAPGAGRRGSPAPALAGKGHRLSRRGSPPQPAWVTASAGVGHRLSRRGSPPR